MVINVSQNVKNRSDDKLSITFQKYLMIIIPIFVYLLKRLIYEWVN